MKSLFFGGDLDADLNGDGFVNSADLGILRNSFSNRPAQRNTQHLRGD
jgi:hypothetical protein